MHCSVECSDDTELKFFSCINTKNVFRMEILFQWEGWSDYIWFQPRSFVFNINIVWLLLMLAAV